MRPKKTERRLAIIAIWLMLFTYMEPSESRPILAGDERSDPETTEVVLKLNISLGITIDEINVTYGTTTLSGSLASSGIYLVRVTASDQASEVAARMNEDIRIFYAEPNLVGEAPEGDGRSTSAWGGTDATPYAEQYATDLIGLEDAHRLSLGADTVVAVLDTGIQLDHPGFVGKLTDARYDFVDDDEDPTDLQNNLDDDGDGLIDEAFGHGSHVAGVVRLTAPEAQIMPIRVLNADGRGNLFAIAEAILYAIEHGADVINLSLGTSQKSFLMEELTEDWVKRENVVIVAAAGNANSSAEQFPAAEAEVIAVTSIGPDEVKSPFSNYGEWIDAAAPGQGIYSTFPTDGYATWSGTSMAVPFLAGQAALIRSAVPSMSAERIGQHIFDTAQPIDNANPGYENLLGHGRMDLAASLRSLCTESGGCQHPQDPDAPSEARGIIIQKPSIGLIGTWVIEGSTYVADENAVFDEDEASLVLGACANVEFHTLDSLNIALKIEGKKPYRCVEAQAETPTPTPTLITTSTPIPTPTPVSTTTAVPGTTATATSTPSATPPLSQINVYVPLIYR